MKRDISRKNGYQVIQQPNGQYAIYHSERRTFLWYNCTKDEVIACLLETIGGMAGQPDPVELTWIKALNEVKAKNLDEYSEIVMALAYGEEER